MMKLLRTLLKGADHCHIIGKHRNTSHGNYNIKVKDATKT